MRKAQSTSTRKNIDIGRNSATHSNMSDDKTRQKIPPVDAKKKEPLEEESGVDGAGGQLYPAKTKPIFWGEEKKQKKSPSNDPEMSFPAVC